MKRDKYETPLCFRENFYKVYNTNNMDEPLNDQPNYTDHRFANAQTIFGKKEKDLNYDYSDRLWQWDYNKAKHAAEIANKTGLNNQTARWYQKYLSEYFGKEVELKHILAGFNVSNGYPYQCFGYRFLEKK